MWGRPSRSAGVVTVAVFLATLILPVVAPGEHGFGGDVDAGWGEKPVAFGHPVTQLEVAHARTADDHCILCHWSRVFGSSSVTARTWQRPLSFSTHEFLLGRVLLSPGAASVPSPRGPPTAA